MNEPTTKAELLALVQQERKRFADLWRDLASAQMLQSGVEAEWSLKDIVAHVVSWERTMCGWLQTAVSGQTPENLPTSDAIIDQMNADFTAENRHKSLATVLAEFQAGHGQIVDTIARVSEQDLFDPARFDWREERPLWHMVGGNTFWHYAEHADAIQAWLNG